MQITRAVVTPVELSLRRPVRMAGLPEISHLTAVFVRLETRQGQTAWGCAIAHPTLTGEKPEDLIHICEEGAALAPDLHPTNIEYSLSELALRVKASPAAMCAFDLAFHDLLGLMTGLPLYRLLGGYRNRIQTAATIHIGDLDDSVDLAVERARHGFRMLKIKGGLDPDGDVRRTIAIHTALPNVVLHLDADGGYSVQEAIDVAHALKGTIELFEQPTHANLPVELRHVKEQCAVPIFADQSQKDPASALELATHHNVDGLIVRLSACGGLRRARQIDGICQAARVSTMVSCYIEPALLISAGLSLALSSSNVHYADLDGYLDLANDPSKGCFSLQDGWLVASEVPGLGYSLELH
jgi:L-alanine-DL-glutamate epimerase-like enolase superfamily enzyme